MSGLATLCLPLLVASSEGFLMTRVEPGFVEKKTGESVSLLCQVKKPKKRKKNWLKPKLLIMFSQVDEAYEFCKWINPQQQECDFEWKRLKGNITRQRCQISDKVGEIESFS